MSQIFISYSRKDKQFQSIKDRLIDFLNKCGFEPWLAEYNLRAAEHWGDSILKALKRSKWFIIIISRESVKCPYVKAECNWALHRLRNHVIPLYIEECEAEKLNLMLGNIQRINATNKDCNVETELLKTLRPDCTEKTTRDLKKKSTTVYLLDRILTIKKAIKKSEWFIVVIARESVKCPYVKAECNWALHHLKNRVIPFYIEECEAEELNLILGNIQRINTINKDWNVVENKLLKALYADGNYEPLIKGSPYLGLKKFRDTDKDKFFGRDKLIADYSDHLESNNLLLLAGASGIGKSSLVQAGVIPSLFNKLGASNLEKLIFFPHKNPFESLYKKVPDECNDIATEVSTKNNNALIKFINNRTYATKICHCDRNAV